MFGDESLLESTSASISFKGSTTCYNSPLKVLRASSGHKYDTPISAKSYTREPPDSTASDATQDLHKILSVENSPAGRVADFDSMRDELDLLRVVVHSGEMSTEHENLLLKELIASKLKLVDQATELLMVKNHNASLRRFFKFIATNDSMRRRAATDAAQGDRLTPGRLQRNRLLNRIRNFFSVDETDQSFLPLSAPELHSGMFIPGTNRRVVVNTVEESEAGILRVEHDQLLRELNALTQENFKLSESIALLHDEVEAERGRSNEMRRISEKHESCAALEVAITTRLQQDISKMTRSIRAKIEGDSDEAYPLRASLDASGIRSQQNDGSYCMLELCLRRLNTGLRFVLEDCAVLQQAALEHDTIQSSASTQVNPTSVLSDDSLKAIPLQKSEAPCPIIPQTLNLIRKVSSEELKEHTVEGNTSQSNEELLLTLQLHRKEIRGLQARLGELEGERMFFVSEKEANILQLELEASLRNVKALQDAAEIIKEENRKLMVDLEDRRQLQIQVDELRYQNNILTMSVKTARDNISFFEEQHEAEKKKLKQELASLKGGRPNFDKMKL